MAGLGFVIWLGLTNPNKEQLLGILMQLKELTNRTIHNTKEQHDISWQVKPPNIFKLHTKYL